MTCAVVAAVRPDCPEGHGSAWKVLCGNHDQIVTWVDGGLTVVKISDLVARRRRVLHALIFTAVYSQHVFVWLTFSQPLEAVIDGCEAAWAFFGGVFKILIPDNMSTVVAKSDSVNPRVERAVRYVRNNFLAGEGFADLADAHDRAQRWCAETAGQRIPGTTCTLPAVVFAEHEAPVLLAAQHAPYAQPVYAQVKVHRDYHVQLASSITTSGSNTLWAPRGFPDPGPPWTISAGRPFGLPPGTFNLPPRRKWRYA